MSPSFAPSKSKASNSFEMKGRIRQKTRIFPSRSCTTQILKTDILYGITRVEESKSLQVQCYVAFCATSLHPQFFSQLPLDITLGPPKISFGFHTLHALPALLSNNQH